MRIAEKHFGLCQAQETAAPTDCAGSGTHGGITHSRSCTLRGLVHAGIADTVGHHGNNLGGGESSGTCGSSQVFGAVLPAAGHGKPQRTIGSAHLAGSWLVTGMNVIVNDRHPRSETGAVFIWIVQ